MRKVILNLAVSLDGFIEGPNKEIDWIVFDEVGGDTLINFIEEIDTVLYGRISYEAWGNYTPPEDGTAFEKAFYGKTNAMTKYVFSTTKDKVEGSGIVVNDNIASLIHTLKQQPGKHLWLYGGASLITTFMNLNLVDELRLAVMPVVLGSGNALFKNLTHQTKLELIKTAAGKSGVVELWYKVLKQ